MSRTHPGRFHIAIPGPTNIPENIKCYAYIIRRSKKPEIPNLTIPLYKDVKKILNLNRVQFLFPVLEQVLGSLQL